MDIDLDWWTPVRGWREGGREGGGREGGREGGMKGGREEGREALCENYNIAIGCPCFVQPVL